jgi:2,3-dihydroxybenzoate-AMP ligase
MLEGFVPWPEEEVKRFKQAGYWEDVTLGEHFDRWVEKYAERPALAFHGKEISYREMGECATRLAYHLIRLGMKTYDRMIMQLFNVPELVYLVYACAKIGAIPICSLPTHRWSEISFLAKESEARGHAIPGGTEKDFDYDSFSEEIRKTAPSVDCTLTLGETRKSHFSSIHHLLEMDLDLNAARKELSRYQPDPMEPALFQLSGGTTGVPKIIPRTHNDYYYNAKCSAEVLEFNEATRLLLVLPLMHNFPLANGLLAVHLRGGTVALTESLAPEAVLQAISQNKATSVMTVPVLLHRLLDIPEKVRNNYDLSSFKSLFWGGNPVDPEIQLKFRETFHCDTDQTYGMAEGLCCWTSPSDPVEIKLHTQGRPVSEADEVRVTDVNTGDELPVGEIGECWTRGPYTLRGYYKAPERNKEAISPDGYYKTGDLIKQDRQGNIMVVGRLKDCISRGAEKINAEEVENHITKFPKVKNAAVVAMPDKVMGERVCAFVVPKSGAKFDLTGLTDFLLNDQKIAKFKVPERMEFIDELPITKVGKFEKKSLREKITKILEEEGKT